MRKAFSAPRLRCAATSRRARAWLIGAALIVAGGGVATAGEPATGEEAGNFHVSGFGTFGLLHVDAPAGWGFLRDTAQRPNPGGTRADIDTRLGLQANYRVAPQVEFVGQLVAADRGSTTRPSDIVNMAFASYSPTDDVTLRAGRMSADYYLFADYRHVGFAYSFVRPPVEAYGNVPYFIDGADLTKAWNLDDAVWKLRGTVGRSEAISAGTRVTLRPGYGLIVSRDGGNGLLLKASATRVWLRGDSAAVAPLIDALRPLTQLPVPAVASEAQLFSNVASYDGTQVTYLALGATLDRGPWLASLELSRYKQANAKSYRAVWGLVGRRWGSFTTYAGLSGVRTSPRMPPPQWTEALTPVLGAAGAAQAQQLGLLAFQATSPSSASQHTGSLGIRWDFSDRMALKLQWDHVHVDAYGARYWTAPTSDAIGANVASATLDFVF